MRFGIRSLLGALAIAAALGAPAAAGPLEDGDDAYHEKAYAKAAELWQPLAEKGDADAQYSVGTLYAEGKGVEQNDATASCGSSAPRIRASRPRSTTSGRAMRPAPASRRVMSTRPSGFSALPTRAWRSRN